MPRTLAAVLAVAAGYFASGWLGLLLAIPPGYATAVFPPSGIALAAVMLGGYRLLPGVWLGSFAINVWVGFDSLSTAALAWSLALPAFIGFAAMLQALAGAALVQRFTQYRNVLAQEFEIVRVLLLGGPVACLVNATLSVGALLVVQRIPFASAPLNWWTWWVGDSIGVLVFTPLVLIWAVRPYRVWRRQQVFITAPLVLLFTVVVLMFLATSRREQVRVETQFEKTATDIGQKVQGELNTKLAVLASLEGLYASSDEIDTYEFEVFARRMLVYLDSVHGLSWNPRIVAAERARFEAAAAPRGGPPLTIRERDADGRMVAAGRRDEYFPVHFITPRAGNEAVLGFDPASEPVRRTALEQARDSGHPTVSGGVQLVQGPEASTGVLVFMPVYRRGVQPATVSSRRQYLEGFAVAFVHVEQLMRNAVGAANAAGASLTLYDDAAGPRPGVLFGGRSGPAESGSLVQSLPLSFAGRPWRLELVLPAGVLVSHRSWPTWLVLAGGLLLTSLMGILMLVSTGHAARVEALVAERTAELRQLNDSLMQEVAVRTRLESEADQRARQLAGINQELQRRNEVNRELLANLRRSEAELRRTAGQLAGSNRELEQFAYIASHDLKAPLRTIASFAQLLQQRHKEKLDGDALEFLTYISDGIRQMQALIDGLLELSRVDARHLTLERMGLQEALDAAHRQLDADLKASGTHLHVGALPEVRGDRHTLSQLMQNLLGNAIKFQKSGHAPEIWIDAQAEGDVWHLTVRDNGIGIEPRHLDQIFLMFRRLHTSDQYSGSGIGLAVCKKVVQLHGGEIWATSEPGQGTTIHFTLPRRTDLAEPEPATAAGL